MYEKAVQRFVTYGNTGVSILLVIAAILLVIAACIAPLWLKSILAAYVYLP